MEIFFVALVTVAVAEIGDKTQLVTLTLSARFRKPWAVLAGVLVASLLNHGLAALGGMWLSRLLPDMLLAWIVGLGFIAMAVWILFEREEQEDMPKTITGRGAFLTTLVVFFIMEMGDKTQIATAALAAGFESVLWVVAGSTLGMLVANAPAVWIGHKYAARIPARLMRRLGATIFIAIGLAVIAAALINH
ncbi:TMEM165/GDT1 family protein [Thioalkalivibrio denitrificans]|uniref:TMEM165/GDT1 family protein n=1 Tax=Thioalkalivibrio denitrificans TaxID=108003 RepID=UPI00158DF0F5|nr:TMEM165/GDT1 family protein [Thioalkalivibrio denitrificans]